MENDYLGVFLGPTGVTDTKLVSRLYGAQTVLQRLHQATSKWRLSVRQRRAFVKTFVLSVCDYLLYLQLLTPKAAATANELERKCVTYILGVRVPMKSRERALVIARILPLAANRQRPLVKTVSKFRQRSISDTSKPGDDEKWKELSSFNTIRPLIRRSHPPDSQSELTTWTREKLDSIFQNTWESSNIMSRKIPVGRKLPPVYTSNLSSMAERKATLWYLNRIPRSAALTSATPKLRELMSQSNLNTEQVTDCENLLLSLVHAPSS